MSHWLDPKNNLGRFQWRKRGFQVEKIKEFWQNCLPWPNKCQKIRKIDFTILELLLKNPQKPDFSHFLVFWHFWYTLMTREGSGWLDINFSMSEPTPRSFVKIWAPLPQKCSVLSEYSHLSQSQLIELVFGRSGWDHE